MQSANLEKTFSLASTKYSDTLLRIAAQASPGPEQGIKTFFAASVRLIAKQGSALGFFFKPVKRSFFC